MKTAVSLPDVLFRRAERFSERTGLSRSGLVAEALAEYLDRHGFDDIIAAMDDALADIDQASSRVMAFSSAAARRSMKTVEW